MWKCPVCNTINEDNICCKNCGLDQSRNYTVYRTFYTLSPDAASTFEKKKKHSSRKLQRGDTKLLWEIAAAVQKLEELSDAIKNLEEEPASMEKLEKILASIQNYELEKPVPKEKISGENQLMAATNPETIFGKKIDRKTVASVTFLDSQKEAGRDAWDVSEKQNGAVLAWTKKAPDGMLEHFHTGTARNMEGLFGGCVKLKELDLRNFNTSRVKTMAGMFANCFQLEKLNLSSFDTRKVENIKYGPHVPRLQRTERAGHPGL